MVVVVVVVVEGMVTDPTAVKKIELKSQYLLIATCFCHCEIFIA